MAYCTKCGRELIHGQVCICQRNLSRDARLGQGMEERVGAGAQQNNVNNMHKSAENVTQQNIRRVQQQGLNNEGQQSFSGFTQQENLNIKQQNMQSLAGAKQQSMAVASNIFEVFFKVLKAPISAGRMVVKECDVLIGVALIIMQAIFTGLFGVVIISKINEWITSLASKNIDAFNSLSEFESVSMVKISYVKGYFISVFGSVALSFIIALIAMLLIMAFKGKTSYTKMLVATGVRCIGMIPVTVLAVIVAIINVWWGIAVFMVSSIIGFVFMGRVLTAGSVFDENKLPYVMFILVVLTLAVHWFMAMKVWPMYLPDILRAGYNEGMREIKERFGSFSNLMNSIYE